MSQELRVESQERESDSYVHLIWLSTLDSGLSSLDLALGGVTEAHRSDTAGATVQLRPERLKEEIIMEQELADKRRHVFTRGRSVTAAQRAFTSPGGGSNPSGPTAALPQREWMGES